MLPPSLEELSEKLRMFPGIGKRSSQKLALDVLQLSESQFNELTESLTGVRQKIHFCQNCGFFAQADLCEICRNGKRHEWQICLVEQPTDVLTIEKSHSYFGQYHVLRKLISPLDNVFPEDTTLGDLFNRRLANLIKTKPDNPVELILFFKSGFAAEATSAYIREKISELGWTGIKVTKLAQGLPLYYNPDTLDQATMAKALEDRREVI
jgi:recombination protein RecR